MAARPGLLEWLVEQEELLHMVSEFVGGDAQAACRLLGVVPAAWRREGYYRMLLTGYWLEFRMQRLRWELRAMQRRHFYLDAHWNNGYTMGGLPRWWGERPVRRHPHVTIPRPTREDAEEWNRQVLDAMRHGERRTAWRYPNVNWWYLEEGNEPPGTPYRDPRSRNPFREP